MLSQGLYPSIAGIAVWEFLPHYIQAHMLCPDYTASESRAGTELGTHTAWVKSHLYLLPAE